jgi:hypothetical protein
MKHMNIKANEICKIVKNANGKYVYSILEFIFLLVFFEASL